MAGRLTALDGCQPRQAAGRHFSATKSRSRRAAYRASTPSPRLEAKASAIELSINAR